MTPMNASWAQEPVSGDETSLHKGIHALFQQLGFNTFRLFKQEPRDRR